jgi:hypothetical protein
VPPGGIEINRNTTKSGCESLIDHSSPVGLIPDLTQPEFAGTSLIEQNAAVGDYLVALVTYRAAVKRWPKDKITLRNRARVLEKNWRG